MKPDQRQELAESRAEKYAPQPTGGAWMAGVCTAVVALGADVLVSRFYAWPWREHVLVTALVTLAGFLAGVVAYRKLAWTHGRAVRAERRQIDEDQDETLPD